MPSKLCPECNRITTCNLKPDYCAWCGCSLIGQPFIKSENYIFNNKISKQKNSEPMQMNLFE